MKIKIIIAILIIAISCFPGKRKRSKVNTQNDKSTIQPDDLQKRKNDSILLATFSEAEKQWKLSEQKKAEVRRERAKLAAKDDINNFNYKNSKNAPLIDSLERKIKALNMVIYNTHTVYKEMEALTFEDKIDFLDTIVKKEIRNRNEILQCYHTMYTIYNLEKEKQVLILETQEGNDRGLVSLYIKDTLEKIRKLNQQITALTAIKNTRSKK